MRHISLESGIGCFDYAAEMMDWENVAHCEINTFCQTILKYYWPDAELFTDLFTMDGRKFRGTIGIITCGFPCQPFSLAGKGKGDKDDRFIWPENMRIIREVQPPNVVAENVPGILNKHPVVFERVCADLENEGYEVLPVCIPACAAEEDHIRERIFFIAYNQGFRDRMLPVQQRRKREACVNAYRGITGIANDYGKRLEGSQYADKKEGSQSVDELIGGYSAARHWIEAATALCGVDVGTPTGLDTKAISKTEWYRESIKAYGNAVHWKVAYELFKAIEQTQKHKI